MQQSRSAKSRRRPLRFSNVVLIGFSYTGKSTAARLAAERLGLETFDTDERVAQISNRSVQALFSNIGEAGFRELERSAIAEACGGSGRLIAAGGGAMMIEENRRRLWNGNLVILLEARPETILARLRRDAPAEPRPLLAATDPLGLIQKLLAERAPHYAEAHASVATDDLTPEQVADQLVDLIQQRAHDASQHTSRLWK